MAELAFESFGDPDKPALLLVHGFMSSNAQWLANRDVLGNHYHLVMAELWGHGQSPHPEDPDDYSVAAYVREFEKIRQTLKITRWGLIGQSYGAGLVINYALLRPEECAAVVVTNSRSALGRLIAPEGGRPPGLGDTPLRKLPFHPIHARRFPEHVKNALVADADRIHPEAIQGGGQLGSELNCINKLSQLRQPIMLTNGVHEKAFQQDVETLRAVAANLEIVDLEGGHSVNIEAATSFDSTVLAFMGAHLG